ncbi:MAG: hypothetical protein OR994_07050 [Candidatus Poseidoniales archaeon]|nr:hypothetical protein [Candidatus Poseidoniales archaeon]
MMMFVLFFIGAAVLFQVENHEALDSFAKQSEQGAKWNYVGKTPVNPNEHSIAIQGEIDGEPADVIYWKLQTPSDVLSKK